MKLPGKNPRLPAEKESELFEFAKRCFGSKRKTLLNDLRGRFDAASVKPVLAEMGLTHTARAEELSVERLIELFHEVR